MRKKAKAVDDPVNPRHYKVHPSGVECVDVAEHYSSNVGAAMKYLWRHLEKGRPVEDLRKAAWYATREAERLEAGALGTTVREARAKRGKR